MLCSRCDDWWISCIAHLKLIETIIRPINDNKVINVNFERVHFMGNWWASGEWS